MSKRMVAMVCPVCGKKHDIEIRYCPAVTVVGGKEVHYDEVYGYCTNPKARGPKEFETPEMQTKNEYAWVNKLYPPETHEIEKPETVSVSVPAAG